MLRVRGTHIPEPEKDGGKTRNHGGENVTHWATALVLYPGPALEIK